MASIGSGLQPRRMAIAARLWADGIKAEFGYKPNPKMADQVCKCGARTTDGSALRDWRGCRSRPELSAVRF